ncbi:MAG: hypothetical protein JWP09_754 [Candidatus Taylorbacteria bacterium]|nr:hypothetical protein [Candidatus Taylorbacteria bacterium]
MNKNTLGLVIAAVVVIVGLALILNKSETSKDKTSSEVVATSTVSGAPQNTTGSNKTTTVSNNQNLKTGATPSPSNVINLPPTTLKRLIANGQPLKCTFTDSGAMSTIDGTVYVTNTKIRADLNVSYAGTTRLHEIILGENSYTWADATTTGTQSTLAKSSTPTATPSKNGLNADKSINYRCDKWVVDSSKFVLPPTVTFAQ